MISSMRVCSLANNKLTGEIPYSYCPLPNLEILNLASNAFTGSLPDARGWPQLNYLLLHDNAFTGHVSALHLHLNYSSKRGDDDDLGVHVNRGHRLQALTLHNNRLSGTIPAGMLLGRGSDKVSYTGTTNESVQLTFTIANNKIGGQLPEDLFCPTVQGSANVLVSNNRLSCYVPNWNLIASKQVRT
jgi:hypothetical protein